MTTNRMKEMKGESLSACGGRGVMDWWKKEKARVEADEIQNQPSTTQQVLARSDRS